jgi:hypothetical protein
LRQPHLWIIKLPDLLKFWTSPDLVVIDPQIVGVVSPDEPKVAFSHDPLIVVLVIAIS